MIVSNSRITCYFARSSVDYLIGLYHLMALCRFVGVRQLVVVTLLVLVTGCGPQPLNLLDEGAVSWESLRGRWVVINYWAPWCKPCTEEIPQLNKLNALYAEQVVVLGVNFDGAERQILEQQRQQLHITFDVFVHDPAAPMGWERPVVLPTTLVFAPDGRLQATLVGPQTASGLAQLMGLQTATLNEPDN